jgi:hypothetical protein
MEASHEPQDSGLVVGKQIARQAAVMRWEAVKASSKGVNEAPPPAALGGPAGGSSARRAADMAGDRK